MSNCTLLVNDQDLHLMQPHARQFGRFNGKSWEASSSCSECECRRVSLFFTRSFVAGLFSNNWKVWQKTSGWSPAFWFWFACCFLVRLVATLWQFEMPAVTRWISSWHKEIKQNYMPSEIINSFVLQGASANGNKLCRDSCLRLHIVAPSE